ncbi:hypothetical protein HG530_010413 [Fusarium avenaceum]|nr:hypothetical protein HG530_010413 [Fusarium avenaceum]
MTVSQADSYMTLVELLIWVKYKSVPARSFWERSAHSGFWVWFARTAAPGPVVDTIALVVDQLDLPRPVPDLVGPVKIFLLARDAGETGGELEETAVADRVLVSHAMEIGFQDLPVETTTTSLCVPATDKLVEDVDADVEPRREALVGLREVSLSGGEDG